MVVMVIFYMTVTVCGVGSGGAASCCSSSEKENRNQKCTFLQLNSPPAHQPPHTDCNTVSGPSSQVWG